MMDPIRRYVILITGRRGDRDGGSAPRVRASGVGKEERR